MTLLSIIIPYYNSYKFTIELLKTLDKQITDEVQVILINDGSREEPDFSMFPWLEYYKKKNGGCSTARNAGLDHAKGQYITFMDSDDMISPDYIDLIIKKIKSKTYDVIDLSWRSLNKEKKPFYSYILKSDSDRLQNPSVCCRVFHSEYIKEIRFNENKDSTEDADFTRRLGCVKDKSIKHGSIEKQIYFYRSDNEDGKFKKFRKGLMRTKRVIYFYQHVTSKMSFLVDEIKEQDKTNEVYLMTYQNDLPELEKYCNVIEPVKKWTHFFKGEQNNFVEVVRMPIKTDVLIYSNQINLVGGISTFIFNFCSELKKYYDITVMYSKIDAKRLNQLSDIVKVIPETTDREIICDTLIINRLNDKIFSNIKYKKSIQICHACSGCGLDLKPITDVLVNVSQASKDTWKEKSKDGIVINNIARKESDRLFFVSATRTKCMDKGKNEERIRKFVELLKNNKISFIWLNFSTHPIENMPDEFINVPPQSNIQEIIKRADYLVQLSDQEAYSYSILEALINTTAVICTPFESAKEQGVIDSKNGYIVPYDMDFDVKKVLNIPQFKFTYIKKNNEIVNAWKKLLGDFEKNKNVSKEKEVVNCVCVKNYYSVSLQRSVIKGELLRCKKERAYMLEQKGLVDVID